MAKAVIISEMLIGLGFAWDSVGADYAKQQIDSITQSTAKAGEYTQGWGIALSGLGDIYTDTSKIGEDAMAGFVNSTIRIEQLSKKARVAKDDMLALENALQLKGGGDGEGIAQLTMMTERLAATTDQKAQVIAEASRAAGMDGAVIARNMYNAKNSLEAMKAVAQGLEKIENQDHKDRLLQILGMQSAPISNLMQEGGAGFQSEIDEQKKYLKITDEQVEAANRLKKAEKERSLIIQEINRHLLAGEAVVSAYWLELGNSVLGFFTGAITAAIDFYYEWRLAARTTRELKWIMIKFFGGMSVAIVGAILAWITLSKTIKGVGKVLKGSFPTTNQGIETTEKKLGKMSSTATILKNVFKGIGKALLFVVNILSKLSPAGLVAGGVASIYGEDIWENREEIGAFGKEKLQGLGQGMKDMGLSPTGIFSPQTNAAMMGKVEHVVTVETKEPMFAASVKQISSSMFKQTDQTLDNTAKA